MIIFFKEALVEMLLVVLNNKKAMDTDKRSQRPL